MDINKTYEAYLGVQADEKIEELRSQGVEIFSFSKLDTVYECKYSFYKNYIEKAKVEKDNAYSYLGGKIHDALEHVYKGDSLVVEEGKEELTPREYIVHRWYEALDEMYNIKHFEFPSDAIKINYEKSMANYVHNFTKEDKKAILESTMLINLEGVWIMGFIDVLQADEIEGTKSLRVVDYKTSTLYTGDKKKEKGRQLVLYALAVENATNYPVTSVAWDFLKYATFRYLGKSRKKGENLMRCKATSYWQKEIINELIALDYDMNTAVDMWAAGDAIGAIPKEVEHMFEVTGSIIDYDYNDETKQELIDWVLETVAEVHDMKESGIYPAKKIDKSNEFGCASLCPYKHQCEAYKSYLKKYPQNVVAGGVDYSKLFG